MHGFFPSLYAWGKHFQDPREEKAFVYSSSSTSLICISVLSTKMMVGSLESKRARSSLHFPQTNSKVSSSSIIFQVAGDLLNSQRQSPPPSSSNNRRRTRHHEFDKEYFLDHHSFGSNSSSSYLFDSHPSSSSPFPCIELVFIEVSSSSSSFGLSRDLCRELGEGGAGLHAVLGPMDRLLARHAR